MSTPGTGKFEWKDYDEQPYSEIEGGIKLTHTRVTNVYYGDIEGTGMVQYLTMYRNGVPLLAIGLENFVGRIGTHSGSFVMQGKGEMESDGFKASWIALPNSGTGSLENLRATGSYVAKHGEKYTPVMFEFDID